MDSPLHVTKLWGMELPSRVAWKKVHARTHSIMLEEKGVLVQLCTKKGLMVLFLQPFKGEVSLVPFCGGKQDAVAWSPVFTVKLNTQLNDRRSKYRTGS